MVVQRVHKGVELEVDGDRVLVAKDGDYRLLVDLIAQVVVLVMVVLYQNVNFAEALELAAAFPDLLLAQFQQILKANFILSVNMVEVNLTVVLGE